MVFGVIREEMPQYIIVHKALSYEVRRYAPSLIVETSFGANGWGGGSDGSPFGALARYIGGTGLHGSASVSRPSDVPRSPVSIKQSLARRRTKRQAARRRSR
jgi:hypothetical protein